MWYNLKVEQFGRIVKKLSKTPLGGMLNSTGGIDENGK